MADLSPQMKLELDRIAEGYASKLNMDEFLQLEIKPFTVNLIKTHIDDLVIFAVRPSKDMNGVPNFITVLKCLKETITMYIEERHQVYKDWSWTYDFAKPQECRLNAVSDTGEEYKYTAIVSYYIHASGASFPIVYKNAPFREMIDFSSDIPLLGRQEEGFVAERLENIITRRIGGTNPEYGPYKKAIVTVVTKTEDDGTVIASVDMNVIPRIPLDDHEVAARSIVDFLLSAFSEDKFKGIATKNVTERVDPAGLECELLSGKKWTIGLQVTDVSGMFPVTYQVYRKSPGSGSKFIRVNKH
jgi:hypothetical protein